MNKHKWMERMHCIDFTSHRRAPLTNCHSSNIWSSTNNAQCSYQMALSPWIMNLNNTFHISIATECLSIIKFEQKLEISWREWINWIGNFNFKSTQDESLMETSDPLEHSCITILFSSPTQLIQFLSGRNQAFFTSRNGLSLDLFLVFSGRIHWTVHSTLLKQIQKLFECIRPQAINDRHWNNINLFKENPAEIDGLASECVMCILQIMLGSSLLSSIAFAQIERECVYVFRVCCNWFGYWTLSDFILEYGPSLYTKNIHWEWQGWVHSQSWMTYQSQH